MAKITCKNIEKDTIIDCIRIYARPERVDPENMLNLVKHITKACIECEACKKEVLELCV